MIDFHNHIIPNLDDGSKSVEMSLEMLKEAQSQGITDVINTVHFQHPKMYAKNTSYDFVINEIKKMEEIAKSNNININIHAASEVFFQFNLIEILNNPITTFGNNKYMLIEFQTLHLPEGYEEEIFKLQLKNITPIIAHPERYRPIQNHFLLAKKWIDRGYLIQIDCASILGGFGKKTQAAAIKLLESGLCHLVGSDAHNNKKRNFLMKPALQKIAEIVNQDAVEIIKDNSKRILIGNDCLSYSIKNREKSFFSRIKSYIKGK
tara:strand:+ start:3546 stop:4334 length:789 start_codon:yes stop_codon:yes gene_type:complete